MKESEGIKNKDARGVQPLTLNKNTIFTIVVIGIGLIAIAFVLWMQVDLDKLILVSHNEIRSNDLVVNAAKIVSKYGMSGILLVYFIYLLFAFRNESLRDSYRIYMLVFFMFALVGLGGDVLKEIFNRPRPFVEYAGEIIAFSEGKTPAFPSGHATKSMAMALPFLFLIPTRDQWHKAAKVLIAVIAMGVSYSRVVLGAHYVSDVLAGIGLAMATLPLVVLVVNKFLARMTNKTLDKAIIVWAIVLLGLMIFLAL
jgi:undecaprenyl-diphosphatase